MTFGRVTVDDDDSLWLVVSRCDRSSVEHRRRCGARQPAARAVELRRRRRRAGRSDVSDVADRGVLDDRREHHHEARHLTAGNVPVSTAGTGFANSKSGLDNRRQGRRQEFFSTGSKMSADLGGRWTPHNPDKVTGSAQLPQVPQVNVGGGGPDPRTPARRRP